MRNIIVTFNDTKLFSIINLIVWYYTLHIKILQLLEYFITKQQQQWKINFDKKRIKVILLVKSKKLCKTKLTHSLFIQNKIFFNYTTILKYNLKYKNLKKNNNETISIITKHTLFQRQNSTQQTNQSNSPITKPFSKPPYNTYRRKYTAIHTYTKCKIGEVVRSAHLYKSPRLSR